MILLAQGLSQEFKIISEFWTLWELVAAVKATWGKDAEEEERVVIRRFIDKELLLVDEVGVQFASLAERNILYQIIVGRHNEARPTILTTNSDMNTAEGRKEFYEAVGVRVASRFEGYLVDCNAWGGNLRSAHKEKS